MFGKHFKISNLKQKVVNGISFVTKYNYCTIPKKMKAAVITEHGKPFKVVEVEVPKPKKDEVLVKIKASGCCHTDVHVADGDWDAKSKLPIIPGHEGAGEVVEIGENVTNFKVGDRIGIPWLHSACGNCEYCLTGFETLCLNQLNTGFSVDGCLREYAIAKASHGIHLPKNLTYQQVAPILCAGVTSYKGLKELEIKPGEFVTIVGAAGGLGHLAIQYANAMGYRVIAVDIGQSKLNYCKSLGAEFGVDPSNKKEAQQKVLDYTNGGSHGVLCLATSKSAFEMSVNLTRRKGCTCCVGLPQGDFPTPIFDVVLKRVTIRGSIVGTRKDMMEALDFAERGLVKCYVQTDSLNNVNNIYKNIKEGKVEGRIVINMEN